MSVPHSARGVGLGIVAGIAFAVERWVASADTGRQRSEVLVKEKTGDRLIGVLLRWLRGVVLRVWAARRESRRMVLVWRIGEGANTTRSVILDGGMLVRRLSKASVLWLCRVSQKPLTKNPKVFNGVLHHTVKPAGDGVCGT